MREAEAGLVMADLWKELREMVGPRLPPQLPPPEGEERWECLKCQRIVSLKPQEVCSECLWKGRLWIAWLVVLWVCAMKGAADLLWLLLGEGVVGPTDRLRGGGGHHNGNSSDAP